tara:strand:+ start:302 stop:655 length:354 start_codon:yes stop_codon:yes gene_type:complete
MADLAPAMVKDALGPFVHQKVDQARRVCRQDEELDKRRDQKFRELLTYIDDINYPDTVERGILLVIGYRHLERMGDHASNISENAVFLAEGRIGRHQQQKWWGNEGGGSEPEGGARE